MSPPWLAAVAVEFVLLRWLFAQDLAVEPQPQPTTDTARVPVFVLVVLGLTLVGFAVLWVTGPQAWAAALAVGLSILAMYLTGTFHPPAGINPLLVVSNNLPCSFLLEPVLAGVLLLAAFAYAWHRWISHRPWPRHLP